ENKAGKEPPTYLLMLVRPDGITSYYRTLAALEGLKIDYGYEFVEADWVLDFSAERGSQPWMVAGKNPPVPGPALAGVTSKRPRGAPSGNGISLGSPAGNSTGPTGGVAGDGSGSGGTISATPGEQQAPGGGVPGGSKGVRYGSGGGPGSHEGIGTVLP